MQKKSNVGSAVRTGAGLPREKGSAVVSVGHHVVSREVCAEWKHDKHWLALDGTG